jgi:hypothetical protein
MAGMSAGCVATPGDPDPGRTSARDHPAGTGLCNVVVERSCAVSVAGAQDPTWLKLVHTRARVHQSDEAAALVRLSGQLIDEVHGLGEGTIVAVAAEAGREVGIKCGSLVTEYRSGEEGRRPDEPG